MLLIKREKMTELLNFGFKMGKKYYNHSTDNVRINATTGEIGIFCRQGAAYALRVPDIILTLCQSDMVDNVDVIIKTYY